MPAPALVHGVCGKSETQITPVSRIKNPAKIEQIEITTNSVRVVSSRALSSLKDLLSSSLWSWGPAGMMFNNTVAESRNHPRAPEELDNNYFA